MVYGRSVLWFLDRTLTPKEYRQFYKQTQSLGQGLIYKGMQNIYLDVSAWKAIDPDVNLDAFDDLSPHHYHLLPHEAFKEISGQGMAMFEEKGLLYLQFIPYKTDMMIEIPFSVIRSSSSNGFPKVAYLPDRYLQGLYTLVVAFENALNDCTPIDYDWRFFLEPNFDSMIFPLLKAWKTIFEQSINTITLKNKTWLTEGLSLINALAKQAMISSIIMYPRSIYHGMIEYHFDASLLTINHPIVEAYKEIRQQFNIAR